MNFRLVPLASVAVLSLAFLSGCSFFPSAAATVDSSDLANAAEDWLEDDEDVKYSVECDDEEITLAEDESVDCVATDRDTDEEYDVEITITKVDGDEFEVEVDRDGASGNNDDDDSDSDDSDSDGDGDDVFSLVVGDCFNDSPGTDMGGDDNVDSVEIVDCSEAHEREVYESMEFEGDDDEYPGEQSVIDDADEYCIDEFEGFVGIPYDDSILYFLTFYPSEDSWEGGDREVLCLISEYDENEDIVLVEGSLEDAQY